MMKPVEQIEYLARELQREHPGIRPEEIGRAVSQAALELGGASDRDGIRRIALIHLSSGSARHAISIAMPAGSKIPRQKRRPEARMSA